MLQVRSELFLVCLSPFRLGRSFSSRLGRVIFHLVSQSICCRTRSVYDDKVPTRSNSIYRHTILVLGLQRGHPHPLEPLLRCSGPGHVPLLQQYALTLISAQRKLCIIRKMSSHRRSSPPKTIIIATSRVKFVSAAELQTRYMDLPCLKPIHTSRTESYA